MGPTVVWRVVRDVRRPRCVPTRYGLSSSSRYKRPPRTREPVNDDTMLPSWVKPPPPPTKKKPPKSARKTPGTGNPNFQVKSDGKVAYVEPTQTRPHNEQRLVEAPEVCENYEEERIPGKYIGTRSETVIVQCKHCHHAKRDHRITNKDDPPTTKKPPKSARKTGGRHHAVARVRSTSTL